jgi:hypothetical protein
MTQKEIIEAIKLLPSQERDSLLKLVTGQPANVGGTQPQKIAQYQHENVIHSIDRDGNPCDYLIEDLIWNPDSYGYIKTQEHLFRLAIPELRQRHAGEYVVFEDGRVIDSDVDEDTLLDRVCETDFYRQRDAIYCKLVPESIEPSKVDA